MIIGDGLDNDCDGKRDEEVLDGKDNDDDQFKDEDVAMVRFPTACLNMCFLE